MLSDGFAIHQKMFVRRSRQPDNIYEVFKSDLRSLDPGCPPVEILNKRLESSSMN